MLTGTLGSSSESVLLTSGALAKMRHNGSLRPIGLVCETTNICNADCVFCPYSMQSRRKGRMAMKLFAKVLNDYGAIGGGALSLTPMVGDILLDRELADRIALLKDFRGSIVPSVTTNLYALDRHSDEVILGMLEIFSRIHVSTYGLTEAECEAITRRKNFRKYAPNAARLASLWKQSSQKCEMLIGFRNAYDHPKEMLAEFIQRNYGMAIPFAGTHTFANWGNTISGKLPGDAQWAANRENRDTCVLLVAAMQVYWDGRVSACPCCDFDASQELYLGDLNLQSLEEIYNSGLNQKIWQAHESGSLPRICQNCSFHIPLTSLTPQHHIVNKWIDFMGG